MPAGNTVFGQAGFDDDELAKGNPWKNTEERMMDCLFADSILRTVGVEQNHIRKYNILI